MRVASWTAGLAAVGLTGAFSAAAAHAFKGHNGKARAASAATVHRKRASVSVPAPQHVPPIAGEQEQLQPPSAPPQPAPAQPAPQSAPPPVSSGGS